jgi:hypothetical protein
MPIKSSAGLKGIADIAHYRDSLRNGRSQDIQILFVNVKGILLSVEHIMDLIDESSKHSGDGVYPTFH